MSNLTSQYIIAQEEHDYNKKYEEGTIVKHTIDDVVTAYTAKKSVPRFISILNKDYWKKIASTTSSGGGGVDIFDEDVEATDAQRNKALANVSNQTANSTTGKMGYKVLDPTKTFAEQVTAENTIYEIKDVFDLGGRYVTINCQEKFINGTENYYLSSAINVAANTIILYEKGFYLIKVIDGHYEIVDESGNYTSTDDSTYYLGQKGRGVFVKVRYSLNCDNYAFSDVPKFSTSTNYAVGDKVSKDNAFYEFINAHYGSWNNSDVKIIGEELTIGSSTSVTEVANVYYGISMNYKNGDSIYLRGNEYLFDSTKETLLQRGGLYTFDADTTVYIATKFQGINEVFVGEMFTMPSNSTLIGNGGVISNAIINANGVKIVANGKCFSNVYFKNTSTFANDELYTSWFLNDREDCSETITTIMDTYVKCLIVDNRVLYAYRPIEIRGKSKQIKGIGGRTLVSSYDIYSDCSKIIARNWNWDGYYANALIIVSGTQDKCTFESLNLRGTMYDQESGDTYSYPVDFGIYFLSVFQGDITKFSFNQFAISAMRFVAVEGGCVKECVCRYCGGFIIATNAYLNKYNPFMTLGGNYEGSNPISAFKIIDSSASYCNYSVLINPGTDVHIIRSALCHTSIGVIYTVSCNSTFDISDCYFEGNGCGAFWFDENGCNGTLNYGSNPTMCSYLINPHRSEIEERWVNSGWGLNVGRGPGVGVRVRSLINIYTTNVSSVGTVNISKNFMSFRYIRSSVENGLNLSSDTVNGVDSCIHIGGGESVLIGSNDIYYGFNTPYYYVVNDSYIDAGSLTNITIENLPHKYFNTNSNWFRTCAHNGGNNIQLHCCQKPSYYKGNPNCEEIITSVSRCLGGTGDIVDSTFNNINELGNYFKNENNRNYYSMPYKRWNSKDYRGIAFNIPYSIFIIAPRIIEITILNNSDTNLTCPTVALYKTEDSNQYKVMPSNLFYAHYTITVPKNSERTFYYFISKDLFDGIANVEKIRLQLGGEASSSAEIYVTPAYMRFVGDKLSTDINFTGLDKYGYRVYGITEQRPVISSNINEIISYFDQTLGKYICWNGTTWVNLDGTALS